MNGSSLLIDTNIALYLLKRISIVILLIVALFGCKETSKPEKTTIQLKYEVIPEDYDRNLYYIDWTDTLGLSEGYLPDKIFKRPKEIWCFVTNNQNDTLGYYQGLSMAQTFCYFQSTDSIVTLNFMIGQNMFPAKFENDTTGAKAYWEANKTPIEFEPVKVNIKTELRKEFEIELNEKYLPLIHKAIIPMLRPAYSPNVLGYKKYGENIERIIFPCPWGTLNSINFM